MSIIAPIKQNSEKLQKVMLCNWLYLKISILLVTFSRIPLNREIFDLTKYDGNLQNTYPVHVINNKEINVLEILGRITPTSFITTFNSIK
jgi:cytochrome c oxidase assembly protein Cox11